MPDREPTAFYATMKHTCLVKLAGVMSVVLLPGLLCEAETKVPCFIFSGNADKERCIDLASLNRITFGNNSMVISSSKNGDTPQVELLYSLYHHFIIDDAYPDGTSGLTSVNKESETEMYVDRQSKMLHLNGHAECKYVVGIFNMNGNMMMNLALSPGDAVPLEKLMPGVYIAIASNGNEKLSLKFILN